MTRRLLLPLVVLILGFAAAPAQASVTVDVRTNENRGILIIVGSAEAGSDLRVTAEKDNAGHTTHLVVHDERGSANFEPHGPCQQGVTPFTGAKFVRCSAPNLPFVEYEGSLRSDTEETLVLTNGTGSCLCDGRDGSDRIVGADGADFIQGGTGDDVLRGGPDGDVLEGGGGRDNIDGDSGDDVERGGENDDEFVTGPSPDGADTIDGGDGVDLMDYGPRKARVEARLDGAANDGTALIFAVSSERDNISTTVEKVEGGVGGDLFVGNSANNKFFGVGGDDTLRGGDGKDVLDGGLGADLLQGGGEGDRLDARDSVDDQADAAISCGAGTDDVLSADVRDDDTRALPVDCESVSQGMVHELPNVRIRSAKRAGRRTLKVRLQCPSRTRNGCKGRLSAGYPRKRARFGSSKPYRIRRGRSKTVRVRVRRRSLARRGTRVRVRSLEKGRLGRRTTFRTLRVR